SLPLSEENLDSYSENGAIPKVLLDSILTSNDPLNVRARMSSSYTRSSNEIGTENVTMSDDSSSTSSSSDEGDDEEAEGDQEDGKACVLQNYAVVDPGEDTATSAERLPDAMRTLGNELDAEAALRRGQPPPGGTRNALVVPHGEILDDYNNNSAW
ncbi:unnamed protein product, partial [Ectocarpus sp. 12 AP-2014]